MGRSVTLPPLIPFPLESWNTSVWGLRSAYQFTLHDTINAY